MLLREYLKDGWTKSDLARRFGVSRRTIYYWIKNGHLDRDLDEEPVSYGPRASVERKIDPYIGIIETRLSDYPNLSAARLYDEIREAGHAGCYTQVKEYVRAVRPVPEPEPVVRFETPPGRQAQADFAEFKLPWGKRWALIVVLAYSRMLWVRFFPQQTMKVLIDGIEQAFSYFGGVPIELLFDQLKAVIIDDQRAAGGQLIENITFLRFAAHWGFKVRACRAYRAQTKVERPIRYLRENFFDGREFVSDHDLDAQLATWLETKANVRVHRATGKVPAEVLQTEEKVFLQPLAFRLYQGIGSTPIAPPKPISNASVEVERRSLDTYNKIARTAV